MQYPHVTVLEILPENLQALSDLGFDLTAFLVAESEGPRSKIGNQVQEKQLDACLRAWTAKSTTVFFLRWQGSKIPRGAVIRGQVVAWTQSGLVTDENGKSIGTYSRLVEFGPDSEQQMLVYYIGKRAVA